MSGPVHRKASGTSRVPNTDRTGAPQGPLTTGVLDSEGPKGLCGPEPSDKGSVSGGFYWKDCVGGTETPVRMSEVTVLAGLGEGLHQESVMGKNAQGPLGGGLTKTGNRHHRRSGPGIREVKEGRQGRTKDNCSHHV